MRLPARSRSSRRTLPRISAAAAVALAGVGTAAIVAAAASAGPTTGERRLVLFYSAEAHGTVEPCGCTSDPLGDVSRLAALVKDARKAGAGVALVDAGGLSYPEGTISARERPSADLRAQMLAGEFERIGLAGAGLGETDASARIEKGTEKNPTAGIVPRRLASNIVGAPAFVRAPAVTTVGGVRLGVLGVVDPAVAAALGAKTEDASAATRRDVEALRRDGAEIVVLLAPVDKPLARKLARDAAPDVVVLGRRVGKGMARPEQVGRTFIVAPQDDLQSVGRLEIVLRGAPAPGAPPALVDAGGAEASRLRREDIDRSVEKLKASLAHWTGGGCCASADGGADAAFVAAKKQELGSLQDERKRLDAPWTPPASGSYVVDALVPLRRSLRRDPAVVAAMKKLDQRIAAVNLAQATPPLAAEPGRASFVGTAKCAGCHKAAATFWQHTVHAGAWKTLVDGGKQADYKCIGCHTTGFGQVGGGSLGFTKKLQNVQCETCHGPGSLHVAGEGNEEPLAIKRDTPETVCLGCHTEQHSDTFAFVPYLRDIVGPGHGPARRDTLGPGPTGHDLRTAALARAKLAASH